jgi:hypothetical protein
MSFTPVITDCEVVVSQGWDASYVQASMDFGKKQRLFEFYPEEIMFTERELLGLTEREAKRLRYDKDVAYIRGGAS